MLQDAILRLGPIGAFAGAPSAEFPIVSIEPLVAWLSLSASAGRRTDQALWCDTWLGLA